MLLLGNNNGAAVLMSAMTFDSSPFAIAKLSLYSLCSSGRGRGEEMSVWQMGEYESIILSVISMISELSSARV